MPMVGTSSLRKRLLAAACLVASTDGLAASQTLETVTVLGDPLPAAAGRPAGTEAASSSDRVGASRTVIDRDELQRRRPERVEALTDRIPGAHTGAEAGGLGTAMTLRGFEVTAPTWNGLRDIERLFVRDPYTVERVEVLTGADAILEGVTSPGGVIRYHGKRPRYASSGELGVEAGYPDHRRVTADATGPLGEDLAYRLTLAGQDGETRPGELTTERLHGLAGLAWRYHDGELRFEHGYQRNRKPFDMGTVWLAEGPRYDTPLHSPEQDSDRRYHRSALYWDHQLTERLALAASAAYAEVTREDLLIGFAPPEVPAASPLTGAAYEITDDYSQVDGRVQLDYQAPFEGGEQRWIAGADFQRREIDMARTSYGGYELDPRAPDFSEISLSALDSVDSSETEKERRRGLYLAHRTELDGALRWSAGLRHNSFEIDRSRALYAMERQRVAEDDDLSWQGSVELPVSDHSRLALGMTTAFRPNEGRDRHGDFLPARESRMLEATWRLRPRSGHQLALTGYEQEEQHLPVVDEAHSPDGWVADEEQVYKAVDRVEVTGGEVRYRLQEAAWRLDAHATLQRSRSYEGEEHQGHHFVGVPRRLAGLSLQHDLGAYAGLPLQLWYSGEYVGGWYLDEANEYRTEAYTLHHVGATYRWDEESRLELRVRNLTDERYLAAASAPAIQGERRRIRLGLVRAF